MERVSLAIVLTQKQLETILQVTQMTVYNWRKQETDPLPCRMTPTEGGRHRILFSVEEVREWIKRNRPRMLESLNKRIFERRVQDGTRKSVNNERNSRNLSTDTERTLTLAKQA